MFERFTKPARAVVTDAIAEAERRGDTYVGTDHILLGLVAQPPDPANRSIGLSLDELRTGLESLDRAALGAVGISFDYEPPNQSRGLKRRAHRPFTNGAKQVLVGALEEAIALGDRRIGTEHLVLAMTERPAHDPAIRLLEHMGVEPLAVRSSLLSQLRRSA